MPQQKSASNSYGLLEIRPTNTETPLRTLSRHCNAKPERRVQIYKDLSQVWDRENMSSRRGMFEVNPVRRPLASRARRVVTGTRHCVPNASQADGNSKLWRVRFCQKGCSHYVKAFVNRVQVAGLFDAATAGFPV